MKKDCIAFATPFLIGAAMLFFTTCSRAQVPPMEAQMASLFDWRVVYNLTLAPHQSVALPPIKPPLVLSFTNTNSQPLEVTIHSKTDLALPWVTETNFVAEPGLVEWTDPAPQAPQKFYRVEVNWWF